MKYHVMLCAQDSAQQQLAPALQPQRRAKVLTGDRLMRYKAEQQSGADANSLFPDDPLPDLAAAGPMGNPGAVTDAVPLLAAPQRGYCVSDRYRLDCRLLHSSQAHASKVFGFVFTVTQHARDCYHPPSNSGV